MLFHAVVTDADDEDLFSGLVDMTRVARKRKRTCRRKVSPESETTPGYAPPWLPTMRIQAFAGLEGNASGATSK